MKVKMFIVIALVAGTLAVLFGGIRQAQAYNLLVVSGDIAAQIAATAEMLSEEPPPQPQQQVQERTPEALEPAAG